MIHIADTKIARRYGDYFIRQINKIEEVLCSPIQFLTSVELESEIVFLSVCHQKLRGSLESPKMVGFG